MKVRLKEIRKIGRDTRNKNKDSKSEIDIQASMYPFWKDSSLYLESLDAYQTANIIDNFLEWRVLHNKKARIQKGAESYITYKYSSRDIVLVKLGGVNIGYEASYTHPAVILSEGYNWVLIAPCSTGRYGKGHNTIVNADGGVDGVINNTGIQVDNIRVIDKWRIVNKLGRLKKEKFNELTNRIVQIHSPYHYELIEKQSVQIEEQRNNISELEKIKYELSQKIDRLESQVNSSTPK